ncbi:tRNA (adenosine(37)-N6)-threonylcarbamoyltransferase complex ATPase subunit type 1 TsaE [Microvirga sp. W0021]|uniref:tRNA threonylcarbamoyladenosine biosynthesis protein TsaE n=1 Tax=Hohaiivirga grylli TaxID=3133970 RepID=A0ABV0BGY3_9HYPH
MYQTANNSPVWRVTLANLEETRDFARVLSEELKAGDTIALSGGLGAGKTALARFLIQALVKDAELEVPSPTFTLIQNYEGYARHEPCPIVHADFYRLGNEDELVELGWEEQVEGAVVLIEWAERAPSALPASYLNITMELDFTDSNKRLAIVTATGDMIPRLERLEATQSILRKSGWNDARRVTMQGDASSRLYERLVRPNGETSILMISPARPDGPPIRRGKSYSTIAKLAENINAFVAMDRGLRALGFSAPKIYGEDLEAGLLVIEDLGSEPVVDGNGPIPERYAEATTLLSRLHSTVLPQVLPVADGVDHILPPYDMEALLIEVDLLLEWYVPHIANRMLSSPAKFEFANLWAATLKEITEATPTWTLRDFHSPNLIWLPEREGVKRLGVIDFQDAVLGHPSYDVASLLQDARVDVAPDLELKLLGHYIRERRALDETFDMASFARAYAIMGAQRATKILGIFARLDKRDHKPQYLNHLPRIENYLRRNLAHPALAQLKEWFDAYLPHLSKTQNTQNNDEA